FLQFSKKNLAPQVTACDLRQAIINVHCVKIRRFWQKMPLNGIFSSYVSQLWFVQCALSSHYLLIAV
ncbi:MAG: hypothetical protein RR239_04075, partial [Oscillospiraceae bacterium]